jgi:hypothetical protein
MRWVINSDDDIAVLRLDIAEEKYKLACVPVKGFITEGKVICLTRQEPTLNLMEHSSGIPRHRFPLLPEIIRSPSRSRDSALGKEESRFQEGKFKFSPSCKRVMVHRLSLPSDGF